MDAGGLLLRVFGIHRYVGNTEELKPVYWAFFARANVSIKVLAGELDDGLDEDGFYSDPRTLKALADKIARGVKVEIVHGPKANETVVATYSKMGVRLHRLQERPAVHFCIVDDRDAKVEEAHLPGAKRRIYYIDYDASVLASNLVGYFEELKKGTEVPGTTPGGVRVANEPASCHC